MLLCQPARKRTFKLATILTFSHLLHLLSRLLQGKVCWFFTHMFGCRPLIHHLYFKSLFKTPTLTWLFSHGVCHYELYFFFLFLFFCSLKNKYFFKGLTKNPHTFGVLCRTFTHNYNSDNIYALAK